MAVLGAWEACIERGFVYRFHVPFVDTDAAGVVHFSNYPRYVERAEEEMFRSEGLSYRDLNERGIWLPRVELSIRFLSPLRHNDLVEVVLWVSDYREKVLRYGFVIKNLSRGSIASLGHLTIVCAEIGGRSVKCPEKLLEVAERRLCREPLELTTGGSRGP